MTRMCVLAIDESVEMDEDVFMLDYAFSLFDTIYSLVIRSVDTLWMKKETQFQKRIYWQIMDSIFFAFPTVTVNIIGEDFIENPDIIMTKEDFDDARIIEKADFVLHYIDNKDTFAWKMVKEAQAQGKEIIDLKKEAESFMKLEKEVREFQALKRKNKICKSRLNEFYGFKFN